MGDTQLLVIGAGPYGYAAAAYAQERGIQTRIVGRSMGFWRDHMPVDMHLRSGRDWSLDAVGLHTFAAFFEERGLDPAANDPIRSRSSSITPSGSARRSISTSIR